ncbi:MAG: septum formation family protein [Actinomycetota bacterium]
MKRMGLVALVGTVLALSACSAQVLTLDIGTCFDDPAVAGDVAVDDVPIVDCDTPHDNEVFANEDLTGDQFPGVEELSNRADLVCLGAFDAYVGEPYETSIYEISWLAPSPETWDVGDREVICFAFDMNLEKITGSINGIGQ